MVCFFFRSLAKPADATEASAVRGSQRETEPSHSTVRRNAGFHAIYYSGLSRMSRLHGGGIGSRTRSSCMFPLVPCPCEPGEIGNGVSSNQNEVPTPLASFPHDGGCPPKTLDTEKKPSTESSNGNRFPGRLELNQLPKASHAFALPNELLVSLTLWLMVGDG